MAQSRRRNAPLPPALRPLPHPSWQIERSRSASPKQLDPEALLKRFWQAVDGEA
jgi:hypothetical protein